MSDAPDTPGEATTVGAPESPSPARGGGRPRCPVHNGRPFDPSDLEQIGDPYPWWEAARREAPVFDLPESAMVALCRYRDIETALRKHRIYSNRDSIAFDQIHPSVVGEFPDGYPLGVLSNANPPQHTRLRRLAQRAFTPKAIAQWEERIRATCTELVDDFIDDGRCDLIRQYSQEIATRTIVDIVGVPRESRAEALQWAKDGISLERDSPRLDEADRLATSKRVVRGYRWLLDFIEDKRRRPSDDLTTALVRAQDSGNALTTFEIAGIIAESLVAGVETVAVFLPTLVNLLLRHPDQWRAVKAEPALIPAAIDEGLRFLPPARGTVRTVTEDVEIDGLEIHAGEKVLALIASAGRDESMWADPSTFDIHRMKPGRHMAFGKGPHFCLGADLARAELRIGMETLIERIPDLRLVDDRGLENWTAHLVMWLPDGFELEWG